MAKTELKTILKELIGGLMSKCEFTIQDCDYLSFFFTKSTCWTQSYFTAFLKKLRVTFEN